MNSKPGLIGTGIYYPSEAARLLGTQPHKLRRWVNGYTYWLAGAQAIERRRLKPVIATDIQAIGRARALSFLELMELRVVLALRKRGLPLQRIRAAARLAQRA